MRLAIVDRDDVFAKTVVRYVSELTHIIDIVMLKNGEELLDSVSEYDLILIDIELDKCGGIETAIRAKRTSPNILVVFTACNTALALEAYKAAPFRYVLKNDEQALRTALADAINHVNSRGKEILVHIVSGRDICIKLREICYFEAYAHTVLVYLRKGEIECTGSVIAFEKILSLDGFVRANKSQLINVAHVNRLSDTKALMSNGDSIVFSRRKSRLVKETVQNYICSGL